MACCRGVMVPLWPYVTPAWAEATPDPDSERGNRGEPRDTSAASSEESPSPSLVSMQACLPSPTSIESRLEEWKGRARAWVLTKKRRSSSSPVAASGRNGPATERGRPRIPVHSQRGTHSTSRTKKMEFLSEPYLVFFLYSDCQSLPIRRLRSFPR